MWLENGLYQNLLSHYTINSAHKNSTNFLVTILYHFYYILAIKQTTHISYDFLFTSHFNMKWWAYVRLNLQLTAIYINVSSTLKICYLYCFRSVWNELWIKISFTNTRSDSFRVGLTQRIRWKLLFLVLDVAIIYYSRNFSSYFIWQHQLLYYSKQNIYLK